MAPASAPDFGRLGNEIDTRLVHTRRQHGNAALASLRRQIRGEFVGIAHVERHRGGDEFLAEVGLHVRRVIADQGIGGGVRLVEPVARELVDQDEDVRGVLLLDAVRDRALDELGLLLGHLPPCPSCPWRGAERRLCPANTHP